MADAVKILSPVLEKIAKEQEYDDYTTEVKPIHTAGANYSSQLYAITISAPKKEDLKLFAKVAAFNEKFRQTTALQVFDTEISFYTKIASKYKEFQTQYDFPSNDRLVFAEYYGGSTEYMKETLLLGELTVEGFQAYDRFKSYDWEYASACVSALAKLHALSVRFERDNPEECAELLKKLAFMFPMDEMKVVMERGIATAVGVTADENKEKLTSFLQTNVTEASMMSYYNPSRKVVLNHGDFRPSNILHRRDQDGKLEVILIDYQVLQKGNPVTDLLYFLISGSDEEFREKHLDQYFEHYYQEFSKYLQKLELNPDEVYAKEDYDADVKEMLPFGIIMAICILPIVTVEEKHAPKLEDGIGLESFAMEVSDLFRTRFNGLVKDYVKMGIL